MRRTKEEFAEDALDFIAELKELENQHRIKVAERAKNYNVRTAGYQFPVIYDPFKEHGVVYVRDLPESWTVKDVAKQISF